MLTWSTMSVPGSTTLKSSMRPCPAQELVALAVALVPISTFARTRRPGRTARRSADRRSPGRPTPAGRPCPIATRSPTASRIVARSTMHGTPVKISCITTRAGACTRSRCSGLPWIPVSRSPRCGPWSMLLPPRCATGSSARTLPGCRRSFRSRDGVETIDLIAVVADTTLSRALNSFTEYLLVTSTPEDYDLPPTAVVEAVRCTLTVRLSCDTRRSLLRLLIVRARVEPFFGQVA